MVTTLEEAESELAKLKADHKKQTSKLTREHEEKVFYLLQQMATSPDEVGEGREEEEEEGGREGGREGEESMKIV